MSILAIPSTKQNKKKKNLTLEPKLRKTLFFKKIVVLPLSELIFKIVKLRN